MAAPQPLAGWRLRQVVADTHQLSKVGGFLYVFGWAVIGWLGNVLDFAPVTALAVAAGFVLLTATLLVGAWFSELLNQRWVWNHKTAFSVLAWLTFATLLFGRARFGTDSLEPHDRHHHHPNFPRILGLRLLWLQTRQPTSICANCHTSGHLDRCARRPIGLWRWTQRPDGPSGRSHHGRWRHCRRHHSHRTG